MSSTSNSRHALMRRWFAVCLFMLIGAAPALAMAQAPGLNATDRADIKAFTLTDGVFQRLQAVTTEGRALHVNKHRLDMRKVHSLDDMAKQLTAADPRVEPLLARHGFTPRQFLVANMALIGTVMAMKYGERTGHVKAVESQLNPANVSFYQSHKAAIDKMLQAAAKASTPAH